MNQDESKCWESAQRWYEKYVKAEADIERLTKLHEAAAARAELAQIEIERLRARRSAR